VDVFNERITLFFSPEKQESFDMAEMENFTLISAPESN